MIARISYKVPQFSYCFNLPLFESKVVGEFSFPKESKTLILSISQPYLASFVDGMYLFSSTSNVLTLTQEQINTINSIYFYMLDHPEIEEVNIKL